MPCHFHPEFDRTWQRDDLTVKMPSVELAREMGDKFRLFFSGGDKHPPSLKSISIRNAEAITTLVGLTIL